MLPTLAQRTCSASWQTARQAGGLFGSVPGVGEDAPFCERCVNSGTVILWRHGGAASGNLTATGSLTRSGEATLVVESTIVRLVVFTTGAVGVAGAILPWLWGARLGVAIPLLGTVAASTALAARAEGRMTLLRIAEAAVFGGVAGLVAGIAWAGGDQADPPRHARLEPELATKS